MQREEMDHPSDKLLKDLSLNREQSGLLICIKCIKNATTKGEVLVDAANKNVQMTCIDSPNHHRMQCKKCFYTWFI